MPVPDYQTLMAPALSALQDEQPRTAAQVRDHVISQLGLSPDDIS